LGQGKGMSTLTAFKQDSIYNFCYILRCAPHIVDMFGTAMQPNEALTYLFFHASIYMVMVFNATYNNISAISWRD